MRRQDKEIKDANVIDQILSASRICRLGMVDDDEAYIVPVNFAHSDGKIYIHSAPNGRKMDILRRNNKVSFEIELENDVIKNDVPCEWSARYRSVMGKGTILIETEPETKIAGLDLIMKKHGATGPIKYDSSSLSRLVLLVLNIETITGKQSGEWQ